MYWKCGMKKLTTTRSLDTLLPPNGKAADLEIAEFKSIHSMKKRSKKRGSYTATERISKLLAYCGSI